QSKPSTPVPIGEVYFSETFDDGSLDRWQVSKTMKEDADDEIAKYDGKWSVEQLKENKVPGDMGLVLKSRAKHHAIASLLDRPFLFRDDALVVQYEVNFQDGIDCGGAYIKLLSDEDDLDLDQFNDRTSYTIMFGPDKCGEDYKLHFIFRHRSPLNKDLEEKHAKRPDVDLKKFYTDKKTHLYTLVLNPDNSYEILVDQSSVSRGSLLHDVVPPVNPTKEIDDPTDSKPEDWDERAKIPDPEAVKPDNWDEEAPATIQDPDAVKPEGWLDDEPEFVADPAADKPDDWDEEMDGEWEAPQVPNPVCETAPGCGQWKPPTINNPQYKGKWKAPLVDNPHYQGVWSPRKIQNPDYFEDLAPFQMTSFRAVGLELWSMTSEIYFDNFIITSYKEVADRWAGDSWGLKKLVASANEVCTTHTRTPTHTHSVHLYIHTQMDIYIKHTPTHTHTHTHTQMDIYIYIYNTYKHMLYKKLADRWAEDSWVLKKLLASAKEVHTHTYTHIHTYTYTHTHTHAHTHTHTHVDRLGKKRNVPFSGPCLSKIIHKNPNNFTDLHCKGFNTVFHACSVNHKQLMNMHLCNGR
uniref:Calnexin n=1 Tax=Oncorhynchus mykiss TaxID=8022 RepID=A0A8K9URZ8_ONCMY